MATTLMNGAQRLAIAAPPRQPASTAKSRGQSPWISIWRRAFYMTLAGPILVHAIDKSRQQIFHSGIQNSKEDSIIV
jgi:hypothetical protein